jgi:hypothetical protein
MDISFRRISSSSLPLIFITSRPLSKISPPVISPGGHAISAASPAQSWSSPRLSRRPAQRFLALKIEVHAVDRIDDRIIRIDLIPRFFTCSTYRFPAYRERPFPS